MRILICHNYYQQAGGEDQVFAAETELLRGHGHEVRTFTVRNDDLESAGKLTLAMKTIWNRQSAGEIRRQVLEHRAEIVHFHNTFPVLSPAVYSAARDAGAAVVQTLHNYRLLCPAATLFRDGAPCERCVGKLPLAGIAGGCYRGSKSVTAVATAMLGTHRLLGTYANQVDAYIALTDFARRKFISAGFNADQIHLKPNFIDPDPGEGAGDGGFALFVGRLTEEKGIAPLLAAWKRVGVALPLKIIGDGPMADSVRVAAAENPAIEYLGKRPLADVIEQMGRATMLVFPSLWYEGFPRTIVESFARGTPVAASDLGSMIELIEPGRTGVRFKAGDAQDMAQKILAMNEDRAGLAKMRQIARQEFISRYGADLNHSILLEIYQKAIAHRTGTSANEIASLAHA